MAEVWLIIEIEDSILKDKPLGDGITLRYLVSPHLRLINDDRGVQEILKSAEEQGFEVRYATSGYPGVPPWVWKKVEDMAVAELRTRLGKNVRSFAVSINPISVLKKYE